MIIQVITVLVALLLLTRVGAKVQKKEITLNEALAWSILWVAGAVVVLFPHIADEVATSIGLQTATGIDLVFYVAVVIALYLLFRLFVRVERIEKDITKIVRHLAIEDTDKK